MPQVDNPVSSTNSDSASSNFPGSNFMGVLAELSTQMAPTPNTGSRWNEDGLEDDVTNFSYESALRTNTRYKPGDASGATLPRDFDLGSAASSLYEKLTAEKSQHSGRIVRAEGPLREAQSASAPFPSSGSKRIFPPSSGLEETRKRASVTIRLSETEYEQLHIRAAEAGLTISAYLRSCTFEAETLRAQVKDTLAKLRTESQRESPVAEPSRQISWRELFARFFPRRQAV